MPRRRSVVSWWATSRCGICARLARGDGEGTPGRSGGLRFVASRRSPRESPEQRANQQCAEPHGPWEMRPAPAANVWLHAIYLVRRSLTSEIRAACCVSEAAPGAGLTESGPYGRIGPPMIDPDVLRRTVRTALDEDLGTGDLTSRLSIEDEARAR